MSHSSTVLRRLPALLVLALVGGLLLLVPMARPALAAGVLLAVMETIADYGTVSYFNVRTFSTGIYQAWFAMQDRAAAAQLALCLLGFALVLAAVSYTHLTLLTNSRV